MAKSILFAGLDPQVEKDMRGDFKSSLLIRKRMIEVLRMKIETHRSSSRKEVNYENASWAYKQADGVGYERALMEMISLLEDSEK